MQQMDSLTNELERDFEIQRDDLSPELRLCVDRIDELRRREGVSPYRLSVPTQNFPIELAIAVTAAERDDIFRLRAEAYAQAGWISADTEVVRDAFDDMPTAVLVRATSGGRLVGTIRVNVTGDDPSIVFLPCEQEFPDELKEVRSGHGRLAEFCRVAVAPDLASRSFRTTLYGSLIRSGVMVAQSLRTDFGLVAVHANISLFYQHMCGFKRLAKSDRYGVIVEPTHLLGAPFENLVRRSGRRNAFFHLRTGDTEATRSALAAAHPHLAAV